MLLEFAAFDDSFLSGDSDGLIEQLPASTQQAEPRFDIRLRQTGERTQ